MVAGRGWLPSAVIPGAERAPRATGGIGNSAAALRAEGAALVEELRRWKEEWAEGVSVANARGGGGEGWGGGGGHGGGAIGGGGGFTRNDPSSAGCGLSPASLAPMLSGAVFTLRQKAGPARFSSPRHGIPINSSNEGSKCVLRRGGQ